MTTSAAGYEPARNPQDCHHDDVFQGVCVWCRVEVGTAPTDEQARIVGDLLGIPLVRRREEMSDLTTEPSTNPESPFDHAWYEANRLTLSTLPTGADYTLVRNNDSSDAGRSECFFAARDDALRYVARLEAAFAAGALGEPHFHPQPASLDVSLYTVFRHE